MKMTLKSKRIAIVLIAIVLVSIFSFLHSKYLIVHNKSVSLNQSFFVIAKNRLPQKDEIFAFKLDHATAYKEGEIFIKIAGGVSGDLVQIKNHDFYINSKFIGAAKTISLKGLPLKFSKPVKIPPKHYFAYTSHKDSYDSRYQEIGLIDEKDIIGTSIFAF